MRVHVRPKQLPAFFKFQVVGQRKNMKSAQAILSNVVYKAKRQRKISTRDPIIDFLKDRFQHNQDLKTTEYDGVTAEKDKATTKNSKVTAEKDREKNRETEGNGKVTAEKG